MKNDDNPRAVSSHDKSSSSLQVSELCALGWRRKWWLVGCVLVSLFLGLAYLQRMESVSQIRARLLVERRPSTLKENARPHKDEGFLATQAEIVRSLAVVERAVGSLSASGVQQEGSQPALTILESLEVTPVVGTNVLSVGLKAGNRNTGVRMVEAIIASYREYLSELDRNNDVASLQLLTAKEMELRFELDRLQKAYYELRKKSPLMEQERDVQQQRLQQLGRSITDVRIRRIELEQRLAFVGGPAPEEPLAAQAPREILVAADLPDDRLAAPPRASTDAPHAEQPLQTAAVPPSQPGTAPAASIGFDIDDLASIRTKLVEAQLRQQRISQTFGHKHPEYKAALAEVPLWQKQLDDMVAAAHAAWKPQLASLRAHEERLTSLYNDETTKIRTLDLHLLKEQQALDEIENTRTVYDSIQEKLRTWQINSQAFNGQSAVTVTVLEPPAVAAAPIRPPSSALLAVCALVGLVFGCGAIATLERFDRTVCSRECDQDHLPMTVSGAMPAVSRPHGDRSLDATA